MKKIYLFIMCLISYGAYSQINVQDTLAYYANQFETGAITLNEFDHSMSDFFSTLPTDQKYTRFQKEFQRGMAFWKDRMQYSATGEELPGMYGIALSEYLQTPICPQGDDSNWSFAFDAKPISDFSPLLGQCTEPGAHAAGIIFSVYMNPADTSIILAGSNTAGIWRSTDGGANWTSVTDDLRIPTLAVREIIDISKPSQIEGSVLMAITGRDQFNDSYGVGVLKSTDYGATWTQHSLPLLPNGTMPVLRQVTKPYSESNIIFACSREKVYQSTDLGETWTELGTVPTLSGNAQFYGLSSSSGTEDMVYLSTRLGPSAHIWRSNVGSISWDEITDSVKVAARNCLNETITDSFDFESGFGVLDTNTYLDTADAGLGDETFYEMTFADIAGDQHLSVPSLTTPDGGFGGEGGLHLVYDLGLVPETDSIRISCNAGIPEGAKVQFYVIDSDVESYIDPADELELSGEWLVGEFEYFTGSIINYDQTFPLGYTGLISHLVVRFEFEYPYPYGGTTPIYFDDFFFELNLESDEITPRTIGISTSDGDELYAIVEALDAASGKYKSSIVETTDKGVNWTCQAVGTGYNTNSLGDILAATDNFTVGFGAEEAYYYGGVKLVRYDETLGDYFEICSQHDDIRDIQVIKNVGGDNHLLVGDDGGVAYSKDGGLTWESLNGSGLPITQFYSIAINPHDNKTVLGGTQDNGTFLGTSAGSWSIIGGGDGNESDFSPVNEDELVYQQNESLYYVDYSTGVPDTLYTASPDVNYARYLSRPTLISPLGNAIFEGVEQQDTSYNAAIIRHDIDPSGGYDTPMIHDFGDRSQSIGAIAIALSNQNIIYAAEGNSRSKLHNKKLFKSSDFGDNWSDLSTLSTAKIVDESDDSTAFTLNDILDWKHVNAIEVDPTNPQHLWIGISNIYTEADEAVSDKFRVLYSTNGGLNWHDYSIGLPPFPVNDLIYQKGTNDRLFVATDAGIYYRDGSMSSWECFNEDMPITLALDLEINECQQSLYAGTFGRGIWRSPIDMPVTDTTFVETDLTWGGTQQFDSHLVITSGNTLTLNGTLQMAGGTKIIVEQGAQLIVDSGVLTNLCDVFWSGVEVHGSSTDQQTTTHQGKVVLRNGAIVEHARVGVALWETGNWTSTGGIIIASNSTFKNNKKDVEFLNYQNTDGSGGHLPNKSYFTNVTFTWDDDFLADYPLGHVTLYKVDGVKFRGCTFNDNRTAPDSRYFVDYAKTNSGIYSIDAQYFVIPQCTDYISGCSGSLEDDPDWNPTTFENLDFGVYASNISSEQNLTVDRSIFENNLYGMQTVNVNDPIITRNEFEVNGDTTNNFTSYTQRGIHLVRSKGLTVQENHFANTSGTGAVQGIVCSDLGESEEDIYRNVFDDLKYGVIAQGKNRGISDEGDLLGLEFLCDSNSGNFKDHLVLGSLWDTEASGEFGVKVFNGLPLEPSGTYFSIDDPLPTGIHYTNDSDNELRYYFDTLTIGQIPTDVSGDLLPIAVAVNNGCPSKLTDGSFQEHSSGFLATTLSNFNTYSGDLDTALTTYQGLVNGGDTDSLLNVIAGLTRDNRDTVHTLLMSYSPYLTAEVVKATLDHPIIKYPHAWGYELVESNIEVAYTPGFFTFLENKLNPFSATMIADVQALVDSSAYTDMLTKQLEIAKLQSQKANAANVLLQSVKNDTNSIDVDSVRYWITQKGDVLAKTREIDAYLQAGDITAAESELSSLNTNLQNYPTHLQDELLDYISFKEKLIDLHQAGNSLDSLSETDHNFMIDLAENGVGLARYQAQELLCFFYGECAEYPVNPDGQQNMAPMSTDTDPSETNDVERSFKIYPNPANTWIAIELPKVDEPLNITVIDLTGRLVYQKQLGGINNTDRLSAVEIWDTQLIGDGVYLITITNQNNTKSFGTQRVVIQH